MVLAPVGSIASTVQRDLVRMSSAGRRRLVRWAAILCFAFFVGTFGSRNTNTDGPAPLRAAPRMPDLASQFLERGQQRTERRAIRLMDAVFERRRTAGQDGPA